MNSDHVIACLFQKHGAHRAINTSRNPNGYFFAIHSLYFTLSLSVLPKSTNNIRLSASSSLLLFETHSAPAFCLSIPHFFSRHLFSTALPCSHQTDYENLDCIPYSSAS